MAKLKVFKINYPGSYLGGRAIVKGTDEKDAYLTLAKEYPQLDPIDECTFKEIKHSQKVIYNWDGDY